MTISFKDTYPRKLSRLRGFFCLAETNREDSRIRMTFTDTVKQLAIEVLEIVGRAMDGTTAMQLHTGRE